METSMVPSAWTNHYMSVKMASVPDREGGRGGGRRRRLCPAIRALRARNQTHFRHGSSSILILMLSRAIWALFLSILIKIDKKHSWSNFRGACLLRPHPWIRHCSAPPPPLPPIWTVPGLVAPWSIDPHCCSNTQLLLSVFTDVH